MQDITDVEEPGCPPEFFNILVPSGDPWFDPQGRGTITIPYQRSRYQTSNSGYSPNHPREQLNSVTSYLDGSAIYGRDKTWSNQLRLLKDSCPERTNNIIAAEVAHSTFHCSKQLLTNDNVQNDRANIKKLPSRHFIRLCICSVSLYHVTTCGLVFWQSAPMPCMMWL